jgi:hypothetical protein
MKDGAKARISAIKKKPHFGFGIFPPFHTPFREKKLLKVHILLRGESFHYETSLSSHRLL